jgi:hypothetical protein
VQSFLYDIQLRTGNLFIQYSYTMLTAFRSEQTLSGMKFLEHTVQTYFSSELEIHPLVQEFRNRTLPAPQWTHEAHLITGLWFNYYHTQAEAICYLRSGIISYNISTGGENTPERGYHETITIFWCKILRHYIAKNSHLPLLKLCNNFLKSEWSSRDLPLQYYSREVLFSTHARAMWVKPDRSESLDEIIF